MKWKETDRVKEKEHKGDKQRGSNERGGLKKHFRAKETMRKEGEKGDINRRSQKLEGKLKSTGQGSAEMSETRVEVMGGYRGIQKEESEKRRSDEILARSRSGGELR